jgi:hypothetical protein
MPSCDAVDPVEQALAMALRAATEAGDLGLVGQILTELKTRREQRAGVASLTERAQRKGRG